VNTLDNNQYSKEELIQHIRVLEVEKIKRIKSDLKMIKVNKFIEYENIRMNNILSLIKAALKSDKYEDIFELLTESMLQSFECENVLILKSKKNKVLDVVYDFSESCDILSLSSLELTTTINATLIEDSKLFENNKILKNANGMIINFVFNEEIHYVIAYTSVSMQKTYTKITKDNLSIFQLMTMEISTILHNLLLTNEIKETQKELVFKMGSIAELRSQETGNHIKRVAQYAKILALHYGLSTKESLLLEEATPMHDIGKIAIPDYVLNKPGKLTKEEFEIMKTHAFLGYEMFKGSNKTLFKAASIIAHEHHEKWDGSGYPRNLKGDEIHIYGQITALADVFDALGSVRNYKKAWSNEKILKFLKEQRGKHFSPKLIDIFFDNLDEIMVIKKFFSDEITSNLNKN